MDRRYFTSLLFRLALAVLAMMLSVRAVYVQDGGTTAWCLAGLIGLSAAALQIRPMLIPTPGKASTVLSPAPAFFLAGLFLVPAGPLVTAIAFATSLSGLVNGTRPHKVLLQLSASVLTSIVLALAHAMAPWLAALLVGVVTLGVGGLLFTSAKKKGIKKPFERTQRTLKEDVRWAKERLA